jgi:hypothetical protein
MKPVDLAVTVNQPAPQAQDRILDRVGPPLRALGFTELTEMFTGSWLRDPRWEHQYPET